MECLEEVNGALPDQGLDKSFISDDSITQEVVPPKNLSGSNDTVGDSGISTVTGGYLVFRDSVEVNDSDCHSPLEVPSTCTTPATDKPEGNLTHVNTTLSYCCISPDSSSNGNAILSADVDHNDNSNDKIVLQEEPNKLAPLEKETICSFNESDNNVAQGYMHQDISDVDSTKQITSFDKLISSTSSEPCLDSNVPSPKVHSPSQSHCPENIVQAREESDIHKYRLNYDSQSEDFNSSNDDSAEVVDDLQKDFLDSSGISSSDCQRSPTGSFPEESYHNIETEKLKLSEKPVEVNQVEEQSDVIGAIRERSEVESVSHNDTENEMLLCGNDSNDIVDIAKKCSSPIDDSHSSFMSSAELRLECHSEIEQDITTNNQGNSANPVPSYDLTSLTNKDLNIDVEVLDKSAEAPEQTAEAPEQTAEAPEQTAEAPEQTAEAPKQTAEAPEQTAVAPNKNAEAPEKTAEDVSESQLSSVASPITYIGSKKKRNCNSNNLNLDSRIKSIGNPFLRCWKPKLNNLESNQKSFIQPEFGGANDETHYTDYTTHYLGLQPAIKFRCNQCQQSGFDSIHALNIHQTECRKAIRNSKLSINLSRKVYLCTSCGTYFPGGLLFRHIKEKHEKYICVHCLQMFPTSDKLSDHLVLKHQMNVVSFSNSESFSQSNNSSFFVLCLECDSVLTEKDEFKHVCVKKKTTCFNAPNSMHGLRQKLPFVSSEKPDFGESSNANLDPRKVICEDEKIIINNCNSELIDEIVNDTIVGKEKPPDCEEVNMSGVVEDPSFFNEDIKSAGDEVDKLSDSENNPPEIASPADDKLDDLISSDNKTQENAEPETEENKGGSFDETPEILPDVLRNEDKSVPTKNASELAEFEDTTDMPCAVGVEQDYSNSPSTERPISPLQALDDIIPECINSFESEPLIENCADQDVSSPTITHSEESPNEILEPVFEPSVAVLPTPKTKSKAQGKRRARRAPWGVPKKKKKKLPPPPFDAALKEPTSLLGQLLEKPINKDFLPGIIMPPIDSSSLPDYIESPHSNDQIPPTPVEEKKPILWKPGLDKNLMKFKLNMDVESDDDSDDSNKLSMAIDDPPMSSSAKGGNSEESNSPMEIDLPVKSNPDQIILAGDDIPSMALTLDDRVDEVKPQVILKECVRTSCQSCNYCRRAVKIAVNGKYLALHLLSEHRYTPVKLDSPDDLINRIKSCLDSLNNVYFNTESYDSSDPSVHIPYDQDSTFDCFQCNYATTTHKDLYLHKRKTHTKGLLLCIMCKSNFYSYSELLCHLCPGHYDPDEQSFSVEINYRCCFCRNDAIPSAFRLMVHLRKCHHTCDICLEPCADQQKLSTHMWKHKLNHLCYRCGIAYASKLDITKHLFWKHGTESVLCKRCLQKKWPHVYHFCIPPTSFICEECNSSFTKAVALKVHKRLHSSDSNYSCSKCEKKFISKKLLIRHEDRHNGKLLKVEPPDTEDPKSREEIIDVTGMGGDQDLSASKESESDSNKNHKKHKKDKKPKPVIDVYDLPPLNLSSDSDSAEENVLNEPDSDKKEGDLSSSDNSGKPTNIKGDSVSKDMLAQSDTDCKPMLDAEKPLDDLSVPNPTTDQEPPNEEVENIWENFYKTSSQNKNLPYPLCAMKTEVAYGIIMGDHDYCQQSKVDPVIKEDIPTASNLDANIEGKVELDSMSLTKDLSEMTPRKKSKSPKKKVKINSSSSSDSSSESSSSSCSCGTKCSCSSSSSDSSSSSSSDSDSSSSENKVKSEKRKKKKEKKIKTKSEINIVTEDEAVKPEPTEPIIPEDPAIRESELETEESSTDEEFYDRHPQKMANQMLAEKRNQLMLLAMVAPVNNGNVSPLPEASPVSSSQVTPVSTPAPHQQQQHLQSTNFNTIPPPSSDIVHTSPLLPPTHDLILPSSTSGGKKKVTKTRRKRNLAISSKRKKSLPITPIQRPFRPEDYHRPPVVPLPSPAVEKLPGKFTPRPVDSATGSGSENESVRSSKRRRIPNKFYGYSSGEEEDKPLTPSMPVIKWRNPEYGSGTMATPTLTPPIPPVVIPRHHVPAPSTPRIQLSIPKHPKVKNMKQSSFTPKHTPLPPPPLPPPPPRCSSSEDSESSEEPVRPTFPSQSLIPHPSLSTTPQKTDKNVYCYCQCPYDEVSEMIACDDDECKIEWFHFECVNILVPPKGQWFCPECRKKRGLPT